MIQYILECIAFQLVFLIIYDFFLKRETFFQWNRAYLIGTYVLSMVLPWVKIEALKTTVPESYYVYPEFLWNTNNLSTTVAAAESPAYNISWEEGILYGGMLFATLYFGYKLYQIQKLRSSGSVKYFPNFTRIVVKNSSLAFSFFKSIFLGDKVVEREHESIIKHELVHIEQRHSWDLLFFELMRIVGWFNPLVYVYQNRISELHEFIADAKVAKTHKKEQYEFLLSQVFQTENISFVNQFFKSSLIKKRIVMLQKTKSKNVWQLKYLLLVPLVLGMLFYTSSEAQEKDETVQDQTTEDAELIEKVKAKIEKEVSKKGSFESLYFEHFKNNDMYSQGTVPSKEQYFEHELLMKRFFKEMYIKRQTEEGLKPIDNSWRMPLPSTARYEDYITRKKVFNILDDNLKYSINAFEQDIVLIDKKAAYSSESYVFTVENTKDFTGKELRAFNNQLDEIFEKGNSEYKNIILTDSEYAFRVETNNKNSQLGMHLRNIAFPKNEESETKEVKIKEENNIQSQEIKIDVPFAVVDEVPVFPGCEDDADKRGCFYENMRQHIRKNFSYPKAAQTKGLQGRVSIMFTMDTGGNITNIRKRGPHKLLEAEAERIILKLPKMKPGVHKGEKVNVPFSIPITFKLTGNTNKTEQEDPMAKYQELAMERSRLLKKANEDNPIIQNLDQQMEVLKQEILANHDGTVAFAWIDEVPKFPGCENSENPRECFQTSMQKHISKNFRYPQEAQEKGIQGRVNIMFTINQEGIIQDLRMRGPDKLLENEAARIIGLLPKMTPGKQKGENVNVPFSIPITFKLQTSDWEPDLNKLADMTDNIPIFFVDGKASSKKEAMAIHQKDIQSINVLKDEAAIKKYGQKAKNGVVEIKMKKAKPKGMSVSAKAENKDGGKRIYGTVTDGATLPLPGATISIESSSKSVISDFDGNFTIEAKKGDVLIFQYIGLPSLKFKITDEKEYQIIVNE